MSARFGAEVQLSDFLKTNGVFYRVKVTNKGSLEGGVSVLAVMTTKVRTYIMVLLVRGCNFSYSLAVPGIVMSFSVCNKYFRTTQ